MSNVTIKQVITAPEVTQCYVWGRTIEIECDDTQINVSCTEEQLIQLRDRLLEKFPLQQEES